MKCVSFVKIDVQALGKWVGQTGQTKAEISRSLGFSSGYLSKCCRKGEMSTTAYKLLMHEYNLEYGNFIKQDDIQPDPSKETPQENTSSEDMASLVKESNRILELVAENLLQIAEEVREILDRMKGIGE